MKCYKHIEADAISSCVDCGRGLCPSCTNKFNIPLCDNCLLARNNANKQLLIKNLVIMAALFGFGAYLALTGEGDFSERAFAPFIFAGIPWGWSFLNKITPAMFLFLPIGGWILYFTFKLVLASLIGIFVMPYKIYQIVTGLKKAKLLENYTNMN